MIRPTFVVTALTWLMEDSAALLDKAQDIWQLSDEENDALHQIAKILNLET